MFLLPGDKYEGNVTINCPTPFLEGIAVGQENNWLVFARSHDPEIKRAHIGPRTLVDVLGIRVDGGRCRTDQ
jgi:hypothetical protein